MVVRPRPGLLALLFTLQGSILPRVAPKVLGIAAVACAVVATERRWPEAFPASAGIGPFTLIGLALSIFLSFRNGACFDRWWEARKAWGHLIVEARGLSRLLSALLPGPEHEAWRRTCLRGVADFARALHAQLREEACHRWEAGPTDPLRKAPDAILARLTVACADALRAGRLTDVLFALIEQKLAAMAQIQATCERIQGTPLPFAYTLLLYRTAWLYCLLLPFGLAASLGWATPLAAALVAYTFFGLDALGDELEDPFGIDPNDLPLDALLHAVDAAVSEALGEPPPPQPRPQGYLQR